jgi:hypothetical protein
MLVTSVMSSLCPTADFALAVLVDVLRLTPRADQLKRLQVSLLRKPVNKLFKKLVDLSPAR